MVKKAFRFFTHEEITFSLDPAQIIIGPLEEKHLLSEDDFYAHFREKKYLSEHYKDYYLLYMHQFFRLYYDYIVYNGIDGFPENNYETFLEDMVNRMNMTLNISMKLKYPLFSTDRTITFAKVIETLSDYCFLRPKLDVYDLRNINVYQIAAIRCLAEAVFDSLKKNDGGQ